MALDTYQKWYEGDALRRPTSNIIKAYVSKSGTLKRLKIIAGSGSGLFGTWYFTVKLNGVALLSGIGSGASNYLAINSSQLNHSRVTSQAVVEGDLLELALIVPGTGQMVGSIALLWDVEEANQYQPILSPVTVADEAARFALTDKVIGDTVRQTDTSETYTVIDPDELDNPAGYMLTAEPGGGSGGGLFDSYFTTIVPPPTIASGLWTQVNSPSLTQVGDNIRIAIQTTAAHNNKRISMTIPDSDWDLKCGFLWNLGFLQGSTNVPFGGICLKRVSSNVIIEYPVPPSSSWVAHVRNDDTSSSAANSSLNTVWNIGVTQGSGIKPYFMRMNRVSGVYNIYYSQNGEFWNHLATTSFQLSPRPDTIGIFTNPHNQTTIGGYLELFHWDLTV